MADLRDRLQEALAGRYRGKRDSAAAMYQRIMDPSGTPFSHLSLRGLVFPFAAERREALRRVENR